MSQVCSGGSEGPAIRRNTGAIWAADGLALAASPTFAIMALLTAVLGGGQPDMLCSSTHDAWSLGGMIPMYLLMAAFHSAPWLRLIRNATKRWSPS